MIRASKKKAIYTREVQGILSLLSSMGGFAGGVSSFCSLIVYYWSKHMFNLEAIEKLYKLDEKHHDMVDKESNQKYKLSWKNLTGLDKNFSHQI